MLRVVCLVERERSAVYALGRRRAAARNRDIRGRHQRERGRRVDARRGRVHDAHDPRVDAGVRARRTALDAVEHLT